ncbi:MAG: HlyD family secretion protein [Coriobacteriales bacterium]|jgi:multidrug efflux pump subunit AcrA (membrane-fusion protein)|nr:HlyD family secretion protein [Coriobacteriales bacterium]
MRHVKKLSDLKDSRLLYEKTLPAFGYLIVLAVFALLVFLVVWSTQTPKVDVIKSAGTVQGVNKNYAMSPYSGEIVSIDIREGDQVEQGDVLLVVQSTDLDLQKVQLEGQAGIYRTQIEKYGLLVRSIQENSNLFDATKAEDSLYHSQYEMYRSQVDQQKVDLATMEAYGYTEVQVAAEIEKNERKVAELYFTAIRSAEDAALQAQTQLDAATVQLDAIEAGRADYAIEANEAGTVHMMGEYKAGMVVQAGSAIASISSEMDSYLVDAYVPAAEAARIAEGDPADIAVSGLAQTEYGTIGGRVVLMDSDVTVPQTSDGNSSPYFRVKIEPDAGYLVSKSGQKVNLSNGMAVEARIKYDKLSYFDYVLESLGLLTR